MPRDLYFWIMPTVKEFKIYLAEIQAIYPALGFRPVPVIRDNRARVRLMSCRMGTRRDMKLEGGT